MSDAGPQPRIRAAVYPDSGRCQWSTASVLDIRSLIDGLVFNVLIGNADAHGKIFSLLYQGGQRRLAPFYDLVFTMAWPMVRERIGTFCDQVAANLESVSTAVRELDAAMVEKIVQTVRQQILRVRR
jgi:hypothetical protein